MRLDPGKVDRQKLKELGDRSRRETFEIKTIAIYIRATEDPGLRRLRDSDTSDPDATQNAERLPRKMPDRGRLRPVRATDRDIHRTVPRGQAFE